LNELLLELAPNVYRFNLRLSGDPNQAEDLTQETLLRAWRARRRLRDIRAARLWVLRIAANLWKDHLRKTNRFVNESEALATERPSNAPGPEVQAIQRESAGRALEALDGLPQRQRQVLYLRACEDLSVSEIAAVLELSPSAVKASLSLARKRMRLLLSDLLSEDRVRRTRVAQ
jgi:RNA polymerase sigma-70 factor (ECF subfamily)